MRSGLPRARRSVRGGHRPAHAAAPLAWAAPVFVMTDLTWRVAISNAPGSGGRRRPLPLDDSRPRRDPRLPTGALRINPASSGRLVLGRMRSRDAARPKRLASLEVSSPSAIQAETRCPTRPCVGRSRCDVFASSAGASSKGKEIPALRRTNVRPCGFSPALARRSNDRLESVRRPPQTSPGGSCIASFLLGDVPLSAGLAQPCRGFPSRHRSWGLTLRSFAPACGRRRCFHAAGPTCRFLSVRSRPEVFCSREINRLMRHDAPTMNECDGRSRTLSAAPGFGLQAIRAARSFQFPRRSMLPWALLALSGIRTRSTYDMHRRDRISRRSSAPAGCLARYPLMGF